jgi:glycosyltransferase involved in cell wall biosynthesis
MSRESGKPAAVIPNYIDFDFYLPRKHASKELRIGWSGGGTHATDLFYFVDVIAKLRKKHKFSFYIQGITSMPFAGYIEQWRVALNSGLWDNATLHSDIQVYVDLFHKLEKDRIEYIHVPYYPITMFPGIMADVDLDIGVCPLIDTEFSKSKSCNKFYEYAALDTVTVASDVIPYNEEVMYLAKNTPDLQDWYDKLERLIKDKKFRNTVLLSQKLWVAAHRDAKHCGKAWEEVLSSIV